MNSLIRLSTVVVGLFVVLAIDCRIANAAINCAAPGISDYCSVQPNKLTLTPESFSEVTGLTPNPCCLKNCVSTAQHVGSNCECKAGHYQSGSGVAATCTECQAGSYQDEAGKTTCKPCAGGTTGGTGRTTGCPANSCANGTNVATWVPTTWNNGVVEHLCEISTCFPGYHEDNSACVGNAYTIKFNVGGGATTQPDKSGCTYGAACSWTNTTTKIGSALIGWAIASGGPVSYNTSITANFLSPTPPTHNGYITLYAVWQSCPNSTGVQSYVLGTCTIENCVFGYRLNSNECIACNTAGQYCANNVATDCPKGWFCPTSGAPGVTSANCQNSSSGVIGAMPSSVYTGKCMCPGGSTSYNGAHSINGCYQKGKDVSANQCTDGNCSQFCQGSAPDTKCFYIPTSVPYQSKITFKSAYGGTCPSGAPLSICQ